MAEDDESGGLQDSLQLIKMQLLGMWRHRWIMLLVAAIFSAVGWPLVMKVPNEYKSTARLYVDTQTMLKPVLQGLAVQSDMAAEIADLTKRTLLSRSNIQRIIREADLDITVQTSKDEERLIARLREDIKLESHGKDKKSLQPDTFYSISYVHDNPKTAYSIVKSIMDIFIESSMGETRKDSSMTEKFLQEQIAEYESRLLKAEDNLKIFKQQNINFMSGQAGGYFKQYSDANERLRNAELELREGIERSKRLTEELNKVMAGVSEYEGFQMASPFDDRIAKLNQQLDDLRLQYTDKHPNIVALRDTIKQLEAEKVNSLSNVEKRTSGSELTNNKLYQELTMEQGRVNAEISALQVRVKEYQNEVERLKNLIDTIPDVEAKLAQLDRDYAVNKEKYNSLLSRRESASISKQAGVSSDQVMFKIIEAPKVPVLPEGPNRPLLLSAVYLLSLVAGIAIAWLLSQLKPTVMDSKSITEKFGYPVIGVVSVVMSEMQKSYERRKLFGFIAICLLHLSTSVFLVFSQVMYDDPLALAKMLLKGV